VHYGDYKTILSAKNGMNLYRGCTHGCIYCDIKPTTSSRICINLKQKSNKCHCLKDKDNVIYSNY